MSIAELQLKREQLAIELEYQKQLTEEAKTQWQRGLSIEKENRISYEMIEIERQIRTTPAETPELFNDNTDGKQHYGKDYE